MTTDPCDGVVCPNNGVCQAHSNGSTSCVCQMACTLDYRPVCGSDNKTYGNLCALKADACMLKKNISVLYEGECGMKIGRYTNTSNLLTCEYLIQNINVCFFLSLISSFLFLSFSQKNFCSVHSFLDHIIIYTFLVTYLCSFIFFSSSLSSCSSCSFCSQYCAFCSSCSS